jgi:hypothetical protein
VDVGFSDPNLKKKWHPGFITMSKKTKTGVNVVELLTKLFGKINTIIFDYVKNPELTSKPGTERRTQNKKLMKKYPKKVRISIRKDFMAIGFNKNFLKWMHKKIKIKEPSYKNSLKGDRVLYINYKTLNKF